MFSTVSFFDLGLGCFAFMMFEKERECVCLARIFDFLVRLRESWVVHLSRPPCSFSCHCTHLFKDWRWRMVTPSFSDSEFIFFQKSTTFFVCFFKETSEKVIRKMAPVEKRPKKSRHSHHLSLSRTCSVGI
jgi:hypothetical protein